MIAFDKLSRSLAVVLAGAVATDEPQWIASYSDVTGVNATQRGTTNGATAVTVIGPPGGVQGGVLELLSFSLSNVDSAAVTVTMQYVDGADIHNLITVDLQPGETLTYEDRDGWFCLDVNGNVKTSSGSSLISDAQSAALSAGVAASTALSAAGSAGTRASVADSKAVSDSVVMSTNKSLGDSANLSQSVLISSLTSRVSSAGF